MDNSYRWRARFVSLFIVAAIFTSLISYMYGSGAGGQIVSVKVEGDYDETVESIKAVDYGQNKITILPQYQFKWFELFLSAIMSLGMIFAVFLWVHTGVKKTFFAHPPPLSESDNSNGSPLDDESKPPSE